MAQTPIVAVAVRKRLAADLAANGGDADWVYQTPLIGAYPRAGNAWNDLQQFAQKATA